MTCDEALENLSAMLDGELDEAQSAQVQAHLDGCARCRAVMEAYRDIDGLLLDDQIDPPAALRENVMREVRAHKPARTPRGVRAALALFAAAAAVFVLLAGTGVIPLPGLFDAGRANVSVGQTLHERLDRSRQRTQAKKLASETGCAVLAIWNGETPEALTGCTYTEQDGARVYELDAQTAEALYQSLSEDEAAWFSGEEETGQTVLVLFFS